MKKLLLFLLIAAVIAACIFFIFAKNVENNNTILPIAQITGPTEAADIQKRWQEDTEELYKKDL